MSPLVRLRAARGTGFRDRHIRQNRTRYLAYRVALGAVGALVIVAGALLLPLPGPGWLIIFAGLAILATEFAWAHRLLHYARERVAAWTAWVRRQSVLVRAGIGMGCLMLVAVVIVGYLGVGGVPAWLPDVLENWLVSWVPPIG